MRTDVERVVVPAEDGVGGGQDARPAVKHCGDAGLGDADRLLLHGLVDRDAVVGVHLVELVDAHHAAVGQHHRAALDRELARVGVLYDGRSQPRCRGAFARGVDRDRRGPLHELQEL